MVRMPSSSAFAERLRNVGLTRPVAQRRRGRCRRGHDARPDLKIAAPSAFQQRHGSANLQGRETPQTSIRLASPISGDRDSLPTMTLTSPASSLALLSSLPASNHGPKARLRACVADTASALLKDFGDHTRTNLRAALIAEVDAALIEVALAHSAGNQSRAAALLGLSRNTLRKRIDDLGLGAEPN